MTKFEIDWDTADRIAVDALKAHHEMVSQNLHDWLGEPIKNAWRKEDIGNCVVVKNALEVVLDYFGEKPPVYNFEKKEETVSSKFEDSPEGQEWLINLLKEQEVTVTFEKSDGSERVMRCTLSDKIIPQKPIVEGAVVKPKRAHSDEVLPVYDVEVEGWRSFRWDSIKTVEFSL